MKYCLLILLLFIARTSLCQQSAVNEKLKAYYQQQFTENIKQQLDKIDWNHVQKTTQNNTILYIIPVVVHVLHNYGAELLADNIIFSGIQNINNYLLQQIPDTANIILKFKSVDASTQIVLKLATIDPNGHPTKGIEHIYTYLTNYTSNQSMVNLWPPDRYLNIWTTSTIEQPVAAIRIYPSEAQVTPYYDGIVTLSYYFSSLADVFPSYLGLLRPCGYNNNGPANQILCIDNDMIADTPPCNDAYIYNANVYDSVCDTPNVQNIMNYNPVNVSFMFTYGQGKFMQAALQQDIGQRDSLVTINNQTLTGMNLSMPDMQPVADFSATGILLNDLCPFFWPGKTVNFNNHSWNDTIISSQWAFSSSAAVPSASTFNTTNQFSQPGWDSATLTVTGNNTGQASITKPFFIADTNATNGQGYYQEFNPNGDLDKWPMFNYYNNNFKWQLANVGYYDNTSLEYQGYDTRTVPAVYTGSPNGDIDDVCTTVFDLSGFTGTCYLNFLSSGAYRLNANLFFDEFEIDYKVNGALTWTVLKTFTQDSIDNMGLQIAAYIPQAATDWKQQSVPLPPAAKASKVVFRLRYMPGVNSQPNNYDIVDNNDNYSAGNNFYIDRINFSPYPASVNTVSGANSSVSIYPNPAASFVSVNITEPGIIGEYKVCIVDITGKTVYELQSITNDNTTELKIPIAGTLAKGLYMVNIITARQTTMQKLVVE